MDEVTPASAFQGWGELGNAFHELEAAFKPSAFVQVMGDARLTVYDGSPAGVLTPDPDCPDRMPWFLEKMSKDTSFTSRFASYWHSENILIGVIALFAGDADVKPNLPVLILPLPVGNSTAPLLDAAGAPNSLLTFIRADGQNMGFRFQSTGDALAASRGRPVSAEQSMIRNVNRGTLGVIGT